MTYFHNTKQWGWIDLILFIKNTKIPPKACVICRMFQMVLTLDNWRIPMLVKAQHVSKRKDNQTWCCPSNGYSTGQGINIELGGYVKIDDKMFKEKTP